MSGTGKQSTCILSVTWNCDDLGYDYRTSLAQIANLNILQQDTDFSSLETSLVKSGWRLVIEKTKGGDIKRRIHPKSRCSWALLTRHRYRSIMYKTLRALQMSWTMQVDHSSSLPPPFWGSDCWQNQRPRSAFSSTLMRALFDKRFDWRTQSLDKQTTVSASCMHSKIGTPTSRKVSHGLGTHPPKSSSTSFVLGWSWNQKERPRGTKARALRHTNLPRLYQGFKSTEHQVVPQESDPYPHIQLARTRGKDVAYATDLDLDNSDSPTRMLSFLELLG